MATIRIHLDDTTVDILVDATLDAKKAAEAIYSQKCIWVSKTRVYPMNRLVFVEVIP